MVEPAMLKLRAPNEVRTNGTDRRLVLDEGERAQRIQYRLAVLTYKVLYSEAPRYLGPLVRVAICLADSTNTQVYQQQPSCGTTHQTVNCWRPSLRGCCST